MAIFYLMPLRQLCLKTIQCKSMRWHPECGQSTDLFPKSHILDMYLLTKDRVLERIYPWTAA